MCIQFNAGVVYYNRSKGTEKIKKRKEDKTMTKMQINALENAQKVFGEKEFTEKEWMNVACGKYALTTAIYNGHVKAINHTERTYYTVAEIVKMLNDCAYNDCYGCDWFYQIDENGQVYEDNTTTTYKLI